MTRFGMKGEEMNTIGELIGRVFQGDDPKSIKSDVREFRSRFQEVKYCLGVDIDSK